MVIREQGWQWDAHWTEPVSQVSIAVIEAPEESYDDHYERRKREEGRRRVPVGFLRALEPAEDDGDA